MPPFASIAVTRTHKLRRVPTTAAAQTELFSHRCALPLTHIQTAAPELNDSQRRDLRVYGGEGTGGLGKARTSVGRSIHVKFRWSAVVH